MKNVVVTFDKTWKDWWIQLERLIWWRELMKEWMVEHIISVTEDNGKLICEDLGKDFNNWLYSDADKMTWYVEDNELKGEAVKDGKVTNYTYRFTDFYMGWDEVQDFIKKFSDGTITQEDIDKNTRPIGGLVSFVCGFPKSA